jgi:hypothetical protein
MAAAPENSDLITTGGIALLAIIGGIAKANQWRDGTGKFSAAMMFSGLALCLVMAAVIRAVGIHWGIEDWAQVAGSGVSCYVGPDAILRAIAGMALKKFGVENGSQNNAAKQ